MTRQIGIQTAEMQGHHFRDAEHDALFRTDKPWVVAPIAAAFPLACRVEVAPVGDLLAHAPRHLDDARRSRGVRGASASDSRSPARHFPEHGLLPVTINAEMVRRTFERAWHGWLREGWEERDFDFAEAVVGFRSDRLFHYVLFERIAEDLDTPCRERLPEEFLDLTRHRPPAG